MEKNELTHVGVIGMKWGSRRATRQAGALRNRASFFRKVGLKSAAKTLDRNAKGKEADAARLKNDAVAAKKASMKRWEAKARGNKKKTEDLIKDLVEEGRAHAERRGKKFDAKKEKAFWDAMFREELNINRRRRNKEMTNKVVSAIEDVIAWSVG